MSDESLTLVPPEPVKAVSAESANELVALEPEEVQRLDGMVSAYVDQLAQLDTHSKAFESKVGSIRALGNDDLRRSAEVSNRLLQTPMRALERSGDGGPVARSLTELRSTVEKLDPKGQNLATPRRLLGLIPMGNALRAYFRRYQSAQSHLNAIIQSLRNGQDELQRDVAAVEQEKAELWAVMHRLRQYIYMAHHLDDALTAKIAEVQPSDPDHAKALSDNVLFYVRQKEQDLATQLAVSAQGYLALDVVKKNDLELVKGVDRATTTTVSALRTAVIVAQALANEKLVLDQITALNTTTGNLIESTSEMLRERTGEVYRQAAGATIEVEKLRAAFQNIYAAIDSVDAYKSEALTTMKQTADVLTAEIGKAQAYLERARQDTGEVALPAGEGDLKLPPA